MAFQQALSAVSFFKGLSKEVLSLFLKSKGLNLDIEKLTSYAGQSYWEEQVEENKRNDCRLDCSEIANLSDEKGLTFISESIEYSSLAEEEKEVIEQQIEKFESFQDKVTWIYINHKAILDRAGKFCFVDEIRDTAWKRRKGFDSRNPATDPNSLKIFSQAIATHFYKKKKKGKHCITESMKRGGEFIFFAHQEDSTVRENQFNADKMALVTRRPEFLLVFVFSPEKGMLEVWGKNLGQSVMTLYTIFATKLLNLGRLPLENPESNYNLQKVMTERLNFVLTSAKTLRSLQLTEIQLVNKKDSRRYLSIKSNLDEKALYDEFEVRVPRNVRNQYLVDTLRFKAVFESPKIKGRSKRFSLKSPNECTLGLDNDAEEIKKVLADSGLENKKNNARSISLFDQKLFTRSKGRP